MLVYALTIFAGAFLLFQVQPLIGKYILPWFGGGPGVWTTCMLFFQVLLLGGYAYAHFLTRWFKPRKQALVHLLLLAAALALLPITPADSWKPRGSGNPTLQILALLAVSLGVPYFVLSSTGPLIQQWFSRTHSGASPYRLYALSNTGSLLALLSYPFYFETHFTRRSQAALWAWGLAAYALGCAACALKLWRAAGINSEGGKARRESGSEPAAGQPHDLNPAGVDVPAPSGLRQLLWLLLPACASVLLLATTNKLCQDVAVIPFLWVLPLALYLLSFIICFDNPRWYVRLPFTLALIAAFTGICWALFHGADWPLWKQVSFYCSGLFICCMVCHGELYRLRPDPRRLTAFYLMIAAGGALGGLFVAVVAPVIFTGYYELHWGLLLCGFLFVLVCMTASSETLAAWRWLACSLTLAAFGGLDWLMARFGAQLTAFPKSWVIGLRAGVWVFLALSVLSWIVRKKFSAFRYWRFLACTWLSLGLVALGTALWLQARKSDGEIVYASRNFYGVLRVCEYRKNEPKFHYRLLLHGRITHGLQFVDAQQATWPTSYYGDESGIGLALNALPAGHRRIGVVGLGTGTLAAYAKPGDYLRIYEINPEVKRLATSRFSYLSKCGAQVEAVLGDARLSMENDPPQEFDLLALDAFSSDAIPVHLLTREAFELYARHLKPEGIIAVHISNHFLDLGPVVANLARRLKYKLAAIDYDETDDQWWLYSSTWLLLTRDQDILDLPQIRAAADSAKISTANAPLWTDDFASLFQILK